MTKSTSPFLPTVIAAAMLESFTNLKTTFATKTGIDDRRAYRGQLMTLLTATSTSIPGLPQTEIPGLAKTIVDDLKWSFGTDKQALQGFINTNKAMIAVGKLLLQVDHDLVRQVPELGGIAKLMQNGHGHTLGADDSRTAVAAS